MKPQFIAEVKTQSPFGFKSSKTWNQLFDIANTYGDMISIHTSSLWGGSFDLLYLARKLTDKPILAKGLHITDDEVKKAFDCGANYVLCYDRIPLCFHIDKLFFEPEYDYGINNFSSKYPIFPIKLLWNQRNLLTGKPKSTKIEAVLKNYKGYICQASFIKTIEDVNSKVDSFIVGENLEEFCKTL